MVELVIASNNNGKIFEIRHLLHGLDVQLLSLKDIGFHDEIQEPYATFEENALAKAGTINSFCNKNVFADDSGICVNALNGQPGVDSAHYSGGRDNEKNLQCVLHGLAQYTEKADRGAFYKAVICLVWDGEVYYFEGICDGHIVKEKRGNSGFGYDPIFVPNGYDQTFGELPIAIKNKISHRAKAVQKMISFIKDKTQHKSGQQ